MILKLKKFIPLHLVQLYHWLLARLAAFVYGWPSSKMIVVGVTGTKGKSTTCYLLARILEAAGHKVGMSSGIIFKIGEKEWLNDLKMTMPGRFMMQGLLKRMVKVGCTHAIVETTSEGIKQFRHLGINYDVAVFTNLYPEHIESHGSFEFYKQAKGKLFSHLTTKARKPWPHEASLTKDTKHHENVPKVSIVNLDDKHADYFLGFKADKKYAYGVQNQELRIKNQDLNIIRAVNIKLDQGGAEFMIRNSKFMIHLFGEMNVYNSLAAISAAQALGIELKTCGEALVKVLGVPGRLEFIDAGQSFKIIVDYAHDPESLRQLFETLERSKVKGQKSKVIHVFGATGGGRDKNKRAEMGGVSDNNADIIILTNDDPYNDEPSEIIEDIAQGIKSQEKITKVVDRRKAICRALTLAKPEDVVLITGKGSEQAIVLGDGKHPWDDRQVAKDCVELANLSKN